MTIRKDLVCLLICVAACFAGILGCGRFEADEYAPIFPAAGDASRLSNFQAGEFVSEHFEWSHGQRVFCLNVPESGDYLLTYITQKNGTPSLLTSPAAQARSSAIAFRATAPAYISIDIPEGEALDRFVLQRGSMKHEAVGLYDDGPVIRYAAPSIPTIFWKDVLTLVPGSPPIVLVEGTLTCPPPIFPGIGRR